VSDPARTYDPRDVTISIDGTPYPRSLAGSDHIAEARRNLLARRIVVREVADFGVDLSRYFGPAVSLGDRGCFHDGCAVAAGIGTGGSHWCMLAR
jgi:hypothetical protein